MNIESAIADYFPMLIIAGAILLGMIIKMVTSIITTGSRERSRREIAAYVAEGSITPDQGERLIRADVSSSRGSLT